MESSASIIILKSTFQSFIKNKYGSLILIFKGNTIDIVKAVAGVNSALAECKIGKKWTELEDEIENFLKSETSNTWFSNELTKHIFTKIRNESEETKNKIISLLRTNNRKKLTSVFIHLFEEIIQDKNLTFDFNVEEKTDVEYLEDIKEKDKKYAENKKSEAERQIKEMFLLPSDCYLAKCEFVISPISGVLISQLRAQDKIFVKLLPDVNNSDFVINYLKAVQNGVYVPIPATIHQINKTGEHTYVIVLNLAKNFYTVIEEDKEIRIRPYDPEPEKVEKKERVEEIAMKSDAATEKKKDYTFVIVITVLAAILIALITLFVIHGL